MADVRGASGAPTLAAFGGGPSATPSTPIYIDTDTGAAYVSAGGAVVQIGASFTPSAGLTGAGMSQNSATLLTGTLNTFTTVGAGTGALLNSAWTLGVPQVVYNGGANPLLVYPHSGGKINQINTNTAMILQTSTTATFWRATSTQWIWSLSA